MRRLTLHAKGNLDVRDVLHSQRVGGQLRWNGINEVVRERFPDTAIRVRHETCIRSDALLAATGEVPEALAGRGLPLGAYPAAAQFSTAIFNSDADVVVLSVHPDVVMHMARHRQLGYLFHPYEWRTWPESDRQWLRDEFAFEGLLDVSASMRNLEQVVTRIRAHSEVPILIYNLSAVVPGDTVHCHAGLGDTLATRIRRFNLGLAELSQRTGISIVDVDTVLARDGATAMKIDAFHLNAHGCRLVAEETVRVLAELGCLATKDSRR